MRTLLATTLTLCCTAPLVALAARAAKPAAGPFEKTVRPFLAKHCYDCHGAKVNTADLNLQAFTTPASVTAGDEHTWKKVVQRLRTGQMPPAGRPRPNAAELKAVTAWIEAEFQRAEQTAKPDPGRVTARRLNRAEYNNTVRDLLGVTLRPADDFPQDDSGYGFDNIGDVLSVSPVLLEKYLTAAERVAREAVFGPETLKPSLVQLRPAIRSAELSPAIPASYDQTGLSLPGALHALHRFPATGDYTFRVVVGGERPLASEALHVALWIDGRKVAEHAYDPEGTASFEIDRQELAGQSCQVRARVPAGEHWLSVSLLRAFEGLPAAYNGPNPSKRPPAPPPNIERILRNFQPPANATPEELDEFNQRKERIRQRFLERRGERTPANGARISFVEIGGPHHQVTGSSPESRRRLYTCGHLTGGHQEPCAGKIVADFAHRAFRRPLRAGELDPYLRLVDLARTQGDPLEEGLALAVQAVLVSPHFLFRIEQDGRESARPLNQHEIASRLSYFLWTSTPDDQLLRCADHNLLKDPKVLEAQVRRMLRDPKSSALVENFGGQWLELRKLEAVQPDRERFPQFDEGLRLSMRRETEAFFEHLVRDDGSLLDFIDGRYTFLNERLAQFYGVPGVTGPEFRRVELPAQEGAAGRRGGILTQASVLTVSSYSTRTSPVMRGKWILDNILNTPPPPPPPDVPLLEETKVGVSASLRQQLEAHRVNPTCASCHSRLDPLGFALENYDAIGAWRETDGKFPIDSSGTLLDGRSLKGSEELKRILKADRGAFTECVAEKLLTYALGRGLERYDRRAVRQIASETAVQEYRFSSLVLAIVKSLPFRNRGGAKG